MVSRKEAKVSKVESELVERIREFAVKTEHQIIHKITAKEADIKKSICVELHKLKVKEKMLSEKL